MFTRRIIYHQNKFAVRQAMMELDHSLSDEI